MRKLTMARLQQMLAARDSARAAADDIIPLLKRLWCGMPPESVEGRALDTLLQLANVADEEREIIFAVIAHQRVE